MSLRTASKISIGVLASALALPASAQNFRHAPPMQPPAAPLIDTSGMPSLTSMTPQLPFGNSPSETGPTSRAPQPAAPSRPVPKPASPMPYPSMAPKAPIVPPHLTRNTWSRIPEATPPAPVPYQQYGPQGLVQTPAAPTTSVAHYAMTQPQAPPAQTAAMPAASPAPVVARTQSASELFSANAPQAQRQLPSSNAAANPQASTAPAAFTPMPSVEPMPVPEPVSQGSGVELAAYAQPAQHAAASVAQQPPVPPATRYTPAAQPRTVTPAAAVVPATPSAAASPSVQRPERAKPTMTRAQRRLRGLPPLPRHTYETSEPVQPATAVSRIQPTSASPAPAPVARQPVVDRMPALLGAAQQALANGQFDVAEQHLNEASSFAPQDPRPEALRARLHESRGEWAEAVATFDRLIILEPAMSTWRLARARAYFQLGEYAKAIGDFRTLEAGSARLSLNDYTLLCEAAFRQGDAGNVQHALEMIAEINPEPHPRSELIRGLIAFRTGRAVEARSILLRASARWPRNEALTEALRRTSAVYYQNKQTPMVEAAEPYEPPMTAAESASLDLVEQYAPPVPKTPAVIWRTSDENRSTTQTTDSHEPARLGTVFAESFVPSEDGWRMVPSDATPTGIIPASHTAERNTSIGFR